MTPKKYQAIKSQDKNEIFSTDHLKVGLKDRVVKSTGITLFAQGIKLVLQVGSIAILARLLEPSDFGLVAMVTVFTGLALQFMEGGLSMATIQCDDISHAQVSNLFWVNGALGAGLCMLSVLVSPLIAQIYDEPRLILITSAMSVTFLIGGFSVQHDALLRRQMRFKAISVIDILSMAAGVIFSVISAWKGLQYWALVIGPIVTFSTKTIMRWLAIRWVPSKMSRGSGVRPLLDFGANITGANFIGYLAQNVTPFTVGYVGGTHALGFYNRANSLTTIPSTQLLPPIMNVMQSTLTRVKNDPERLRRAALSLMTKIAMVTMLITIAMFVTADWLVELFLGEGWSDAVDIFRILAIGTIVTPITTFAAIIMVAVGEAKALMRWKLVALIIFLVSVAIGSYWGVMGVVLAHCLSGIFVRMPGFLIYSTKYQPIKALEYFISLGPVLLCAMLSICFLMWLRLALKSGSGLLSIVVYSLVAAFIYIALMFLFKNLRKEMVDGVLIVKKLIYRK